jgi:thermostable 8-oxoguanine DNA glycosylase
VCFQPAISQEQMRQTALLASDQNPLDKLASHFLDLVGINDLASVNMILESLSVLHYDQGKSNTLQPNLNKRESIYSEQQQLFLNLFTECLQFEPDKVST